MKRQDSLVTALP